MANNQSIDPWHLIKAHQYEEAVAAYDAQLAAGEDYEAILANRAIALLCCGRLSEALEGFATANDIARQSRATPKSAPLLKSMGTVLWLMGHRSVAKELYRSAVDGIRTVPSLTPTPPVVVSVKASCSGTRVSPPKTGTPRSTLSIIWRALPRSPASRFGPARSHNFCSDESPSRNY
jgi:hypothetical protein